MAFTSHLPYSEAFSHNTPTEAVRSTQKSRSACHSCLTTPLLSAPGSTERALPGSHSQGVSPFGRFHASTLMSMRAQQALGPHVQVDDCRSGPRACHRPPLLPAQRFLQTLGSRREQHRQAFGKSRVCPSRLSVQSNPTTEEHLLGVHPCSSTRQLQIHTSGNFTSCFMSHVLL